MAATRMASPAGSTLFAPPTIIVPTVEVYAVNHTVTNILFISHSIECNATAGMTGFSMVKNVEPRQTL
ncbi:MAG: hypothetical protein GPOALKHO_000553 [Sodalis sp.]|nr:MAG: hypothetical protein GPOALKHO_000553 [Sodalis sp.]